MAQQIVTTAGSTLTNSNGSVSFTIGEGVASTITSGDKTLTQGFQQSNISVTSISEKKELNFSISAYPNPTTNILNLHIGKENVTGFVYMLIDINGKLITKKNLDTSVTTISFKELQSGIYILKINDGEIHLKTFKIIKK
jgi:hypothetical protein